ncbi:MAG: hypothetical protein ACSLFD_06630 [Solirubrobacterales bacterium]
MRAFLNQVLSVFAAGVLLLAAGGQPAMASVDGSGPAASISKKKCKKKSKKSGKCTKKPWAGSGYRPGQVCSLAAHMQKKYKRYGLFCLDVGFGIWTLEPL